MPDKLVHVHDVFFAYQQPGLVTDTDSSWIRFDLEFVRVMNAEKISGKNLAKRLRVSWRVLNSFSPRRNEPKWMTPSVIGAMHSVGFDVAYVLLNQKKKPQLEPEETALLDNYRSSTSDNQRILRDVSAAITKQKVIDDEECA